MGIKGLTTRDYMYVLSVSHKKNFPERCITVNPVLTKLVWPRWLDIGLVLFFASLCTSTLSWPINAQKEVISSYSCILTLCSVIDPFLWLSVLHGPWMFDSKLNSSLILWILNALSNTRRGGLRKPANVNPGLNVN